MEACPAGGIGGCRSCLGGGGRAGEGGCSPAEAVPTEAGVSAGFRCIKHVPGCTAARALLGEITAGRVGGRVGVATLSTVMAHELTDAGVDLWPQW